jgi:hypothetical protein
MPTYENPYQKKQPQVAPPQTTMGPQSQRRISQVGSTHRMQANNVGARKKPRKGDQLTLTGERALDPLQDCVVCKTKLFGGNSHKAHHKLCYNNRRTNGITSKATLESMAEADRLRKHFAKPISREEQFSSRNNSQAAAVAFFAPMNKSSVSPPNPMHRTTPTMPPSSDRSFNESMLYQEVIAKLNNETFCKDHANNRAPLAVVAVASIIIEKVVNPNGGRLIEHFFQGLTMAVPAVTNSNNIDPRYHAIIGQELLLVNWKKMFNIDIACPNCCKSHLKNDRTNFSKNQSLFPIFGIDGSPRWCMVMAMQCPACKARFKANDSVILCHLPAHVSSAYPVASRYAAGNRNSHLHVKATDVFDMLLPTYGNAVLCSKLLYNALNRSYVERVSDYYSSLAEKTEESATSIATYIQKDGEFITCYPPLADTIRDMYDDAFNTNHNPWLISDHDRHTREIQGVKCDMIFAQDHTHEVLKNYFSKKKLKAEALWDVCTETGEIACAVLVPSTKTVHFSHAASRLAARECFRPKAMYSDTWPCKSDYWERLLGRGIQGRLGLFHFIQRILRTLRKKHPDYFRCLNSLLHAVYSYNQADYEALLHALKEGTLSNEKLTDDDISELKATKAFRQRYDRYLRKEIRPPHTLRAMLDDWFDRYKCSTSNEARPALGRLDPKTGQSLFTEDTKSAYLNCRDKAEYLQDPLPLDDMYDVILPNENSAHGLKEYLSRRGESSLEAFHLLLAHFANCGMRSSLADNLNLTGTARYNMTIRHKLRLARTLPQSAARRKMPGAWEDIVPYFNHSELQWINQLAVKAGATMVPFGVVETLVDDTGERFFSEYLDWMRVTAPKYDVNDRCLCTQCGLAPATSPIEMTERLQLEEPAAITVNDTGTDRQQEPVAPATRPPIPPPIQPLPIQQPQMFYTPMTFPNYAMLPPWWTTAPVQRPLYCCGRYRQWHNNPRRNGRPPHEYNCNHHGGGMPNG